MSQKIGVFILLLAISSSYPVDLDVSNKFDNGTSIADTLCNKDTQIDFFFDSNTRLSMASNSPSTQNSVKSKLKFLDVNGKDLELTLVGATYSD